MNRWKETLVLPNTSIRDTLQIIDTNAMQIALVVNEKNQLLGTVTDGDIRRGILKGVGLDEKVEKIMNIKPTVVYANESREKIFSIIKNNRIRQIPVLDDDRIVINIETVDEMLQVNERKEWVVIMAGGLGNRLRPLTDNCPKPLLKVGKKPLLETILMNFIEYGFKRFFFSVNYKAEMIKDYFGDGSHWGVDITYLHENTRLGTAGALGLLPEKPDRPFLVMNGDLLTKVNFHHLLNFHMENHACATMCIREYKLQIPYGVVETNKQRFLGINEKPMHYFFVNAGVYVLDPCVLEFIPDEIFFDMPTLFQKLNDSAYEASVFPIREYWRDIGQIDDFEEANKEYETYFIVE